MLPVNNKLTADEAKYYFEYRDGVLFWKGCKLSHRNGQPIKAKTSDGYLCLSVKGKSHLAHRIIWLLYYGAWPKDQIDHINGIKDDNRIENLRDVNNTLNQRNKRVHREGRMVGVRKHIRGWMVITPKEYGQKYLGVFKTQHEACDALDCFYLKYGKK